MVFRLEKGWSMDGLATSTFESWDYPMQGIGQSLRVVRKEIKL